MTTGRVADALPVLNFCLAGVDHCHLGLKAGVILRLMISTSKTLASRFQALSGLPQADANRGAISFGQLTDEMKQVGHTQAPQGRFAQFDQGLVPRSLMRYKTRVPRVSSRVVTRACQVL